MGHKINEEKGAMKMEEYKVIYNERGFYQVCNGYGEFYGGEYLSYEDAKYVMFEANGLLG